MIKNSNFIHTMNKMPKCWPAKRSSIFLWKMFLICKMFLIMLAQTWKWLKMALLKLLKIKDRVYSNNSWYRNKRLKRSINANVQDQLVWRCIVHVSELKSIAIPRPVYVKVARTYLPLKSYDKKCLIILILNRRRSDAHVRSLAVIRTIVYANRTI